MILKKNPSDITGVMIFVNSNNFQKSIITHVTSDLSLGADPKIGVFMAAILIFGGHIGNFAKKFFFLNLAWEGLVLCQKGEF